MADKKPTNREKLNEITASIERDIKDLFQSDRYAAYLRTMSRFRSYSVRNTILIHMQRPDATAVAGFNAWKNKFQRHVKKGEKGITILAPTPFKKKIEEKKLDPVTKAPMLDPNGNIIMEEREIEIPTVRPVKEFDAAQTEGKPLPSLAVPREEWEASPDFHQAIVDRLNHQEEREQAFLDHGGDCFAIYQLKDGEEQRDLRFMNMDWLNSKGLTPDRANYDLAYTGEMAYG